MSDKDKNVNDQFFTDLNINIVKYVVGISTIAKVFTEVDVLLRRSQPIPKDLEKKFRDALEVAGKMPKTSISQVHSMMESLKIGKGKGFSDS